MTVCNGSSSSVDITTALAGMSEESSHDVESPDNDNERMIEQEVEIKVDHHISLDVPDFQARLSERMATTYNACCLSLFGLPADATERELHILFSSCHGYEGTKLRNWAKQDGRPDAFVRFSSSDAASRAASSRRGTTWSPVAYPICISTSQDGLEDQAWTSEQCGQTIVGSGSCAPPPRPLCGQLRSPDQHLDDSLIKRSSVGNLRGPTQDIRMSPTARMRGSASDSGLRPSCETSRGRSCSGNLRVSQSAPGVGTKAFADAVRNFGSGLDGVGVVSPSTGSRRQSCRHSLLFNAEVHLEQAKGSANPAELARALERAKALGVRNEQFDDVQQKLEQQQQRINTRLDSAQRDRQNVALRRLLDTLESYKAPGLPPHLLPQDSMLEQMQSLRHGLQSVQSVGLPQNIPEIQEAMLLIERVERRQTAERRLEDALEEGFSAAFELRDGKSLLKVVEDAKEACADDELLRRGARTVANLRRKDDARRGLKEVVDHVTRCAGLRSPLAASSDAGTPWPSVKLLQGAIEKAQAAGLDGDELVASRQLLLSERQTMFGKRLEEAIKRRVDVARLLKAIQEAELAQVDSALIAKGRQLSDDLRRAQGLGRVASMHSGSCPNSKQSASASRASSTPADIRPAQDTVDRKPRRRSGSFVSNNSFVIRDQQRRLSGNAPWAELREMQRQASEHHRPQSASLAAKRAWQQHSSLPKDMRGCQPVVGCGSSVRLQSQQIEWPYFC